MRIPFVAGNWKMFKNVKEAVAFTNALQPLVAHLEGVDVVIAPPFTALHAVATAAHGTRIGTAAQDVYFEREGAFTGEISPAMIKEAGATYAIVGHSERRRLFGDTDQVVNRKAAAALDGGLVAIVCIGETLEERERDQTFTVLDRQIGEGLKGLAAGFAAVPRIIVAYEPVWAIGTGRNATAAQAEEAHAHIRRRLREGFGADAGERCRVIYGGSVKPDNIRELIAQPDVDGALVGGASLEAKSFASIAAGCRGAAV
jgi:triosephosphate isomerase